MVRIRIAIVLAAAASGAALDLVGAVSASLGALAVIWSLVESGGTNWDATRRYRSRRISPRIEALDANCRPGIRRALPGDAIHARRDGGLLSSERPVFFLPGFRGW